MAVARAVYTDLVIIPETLSASTKPNTTQVPKIITSLYKQAYGETGDAYAAYDATNEHWLIDTEKCKELIISEAEEIVTAWHYSGKETAVPSSKLSDTAITKIKGWLKKSPTRLTNARTMGEVWDDY